MNWTTVQYAPPEIDETVKVTTEEYAKRLEAARESMEAGALNYLAVYADRERFANLLFLTGYEPRFEEALLLIGKAGHHLLLVGNEGWGYAHSVLAAPNIEIGLCPSLSLSGQPRDFVRSGKRLADWINAFGIGPGAVVGLVGSKSFSDDETPYPERANDVPLYVAMAFDEAARFIDATALLTHPSKGLRCAGRLTTAADIARFDEAAEGCYAGVLRLLAGLRPGMTEEEAATLLGFTGRIPLSYHIALGFGEKHVNAGLGSPTSKKLETGEPVTFGYGIWGANIARTGFGVAEGSQLPSVASGYVENLAAPYFRCLKNWYESLEVGITGGQVFEAVKWFVDDEKYGVGLNPGHLLHYDEWPATPFYAESGDRLQSGMFIQCDIIPASGAPYFGIHTEDGLVLADAELRSDLQKEFPRVWARIARRIAAVSSLGIELNPGVLPLSSMAACCCPYLLDSSRALCE